MLQSKLLIEGIGEVDNSNYKNSSGIQTIIDHFNNHIAIF